MVDGNDAFDLVIIAVPEGVTEFLGRHYFHSANEEARVKDKVI